MQRVFRSHLDQFVIVFIDDILIYSNSAEQHAEHLKTMLQTLWEHQLYEKFSKCEFWRTEIRFLGHVVSEHDIQVDPDKVEAVVSWRRPSSITDIRSFLSVTPPDAPQWIWQSAIVPKGNKPQILRGKFKP